MPQTSTAASHNAAQICDVVCQFNSMDATVQGAIIGSSSALLAAVLATVITAFVTYLQLRSQRAERQTDRALEIKKDVLMQVLDGISESRAALTRIANLDMPLSQIQEDFNRGNRTAQRAHGVASVPIIDALQRYNEESAKIFMPMMFKRMELDALKMTCDSAQQRMLDHHGVSNRLIERHQEQSLSGPTSEESLQLSRKLLALSSENSKKADDAFNEFRMASEQISSLIEPLARKAVDSQLYLHSLVQKITQLIRAEIGVDKAPSDEYLRASSVSKVRVNEAIDEALSSAGVAPRSGEGSNPS